MLCDSDPEKAQEAIGVFSQYMRETMETLDEKELVPFDKELKLTMDFLYMEKLRFEEHISWEFDLQVTDFYLPPLTLVTFVGNAIKHGRDEEHAFLHIKVRTRRQEDMVVLEIEDDGKGFDPDLIMEDGKMHVGIDSARKRVEYLCKGWIKICSSVKGSCTVYVFLPQRN